MRRYERVLMQPLGANMRSELCRLAMTGAAADMFEPRESCSEVVAEGEQSIGKLCQRFRVPAALASDGKAVGSRGAECRCFTSGIGEPLSDTRCQIWLATMASPDHGRVLSADRWNH